MSPSSGKTGFKPAALRKTFADVSLGALAGDSQALQRGEACYRLLFELNPCPMWICDENTWEFLDVNKAALKLYGWSRRDFLGMTAKDIRPPEDVPKFLHVVESQRRSRALFAGEWRHVKRNGRVFDVAVTISSFVYGDRPVRLVLVNDITGRKRAEAELKQLNATLERRVAERTGELSDANERMQAVMDTALVGILILDDRGGIESINPAASQIFGYEPPEMLGQNIGRLMASPDQKPDEEFLARHLRADGQAFKNGSREILGIRKDDHGILLELTLTEFTHRGQRRFMAMVRNISARKRLERELMERNECERQRLGHDLHDSLGQHLHGISYLTALLEKDLREESSPRAAAAGQLNAYLIKALEMTRGLAQGLQPVKSVPEGLMIALRELANRTREVYRIDCRLDCRSPVFVYGQSAANHLYRIAQESVNNATKHGKSARIRISLAATAGKIVLSVRDNGVGIRSPVHPGMGMGLHVMQYRAEAAGGSLLVRRHPRGGTEVVCTVAGRDLIQPEDKIK